MSPPFFYDTTIRYGSKDHFLTDESSKHIVQVLRMRPGDQLNITDGKGNLYLAGLTDANKKTATVKIISSTFSEPSKQKISIAISLVKNTSRFEWFLEKATEIGITNIIPLICARTEKQHFRFNRMQAIIVSAMLQSQQLWLPVLDEPLVFDELFKKQEIKSGEKFIAHCIEDGNKSRLSLNADAGSAVVLIGPEGDFTPEKLTQLSITGLFPFH